MGSPVAEAVGRGDHPAGTEQEASTAVLALKFHRRHVRPGMGCHLMAPDDPGTPGACGQGRTASGWGRKKGGGNGRLRHLLGRGLGGGQQVEMGWRRGAQGRSPSVCWEESGPQKTWAWASTLVPHPGDKQGNDPEG